MPTDYNEQTVIQLRETLMGRGLDHRGRKAQLVKRLEQADKQAFAADAKRAKQRERTGLSPETKQQLLEQFSQNADRLSAIGRTAEAAAFYALARSFQMDGPAVRNAIAEAQVHATLALVEAHVTPLVGEPMQVQLADPLRDALDEAEQLRLALAEAQAENRRLLAQITDDSRDLP